MRNVWQFEREMPLTWSPVMVPFGMVMEALGGGAMLEELHHWRRDLKSIALLYVQAGSRAGL